MVSFKPAIILVLIRVLSTQSVIRQIYKSDGDLNVALLIGNCLNNSDIIPYSTHTLLTSAIWTVQRLNFLDTVPLSLGLYVYETCTENDYYKTIFELYEQHDEEEYILGLISDRNLNENAVKFSDLLNIRTKVIRRNYSYLFGASVKVLSALGWMENVTVVAPEETLLNDFYRYTKKEFICLKGCHIYRNNCLPLHLNTTSGPFIFFGNRNSIEMFAKTYYGDYGILFVPIDGSVPKGLPENTFVIIPPHDALSKISTKSFNVHPNPLLFEIAHPIINYAQNIADYLRDNCNETAYKINCLRSKFSRKYQTHFYKSTKIIDILHIEPLKPYFVYNVFYVENNASVNTSGLAKNNFFQPYTKIFTYNIFDDNLTVIDSNFEVNTTQETMVLNQKCYNGFDKRNRKHSFYVDGFEAAIISVRTDSWVYAFLSLSLLGIIFCVAILIFLLISICRRDILEGNPVLTIMLLLAVMLMFCSVLPFSLDMNVSKESLCLAKSLSLTLSYAMVFALILSRSILLATASKDIGFMSHIAGPVQSFLSLFIFGVQAALSLQLVGRCTDIFRGHSFIYLMSYNTMLLLLLLCLCPLIYKCQRNYREGKYFSIACGLIACVWGIWMPCYVILEEDWREPLLCFGLVTSGGIFLGAIFIPRTYLMTIAAARDKITSTLPSLTTATSAIDIYRGHSQPVYDCVNVAAINAVTVARAGVTVPAMQQPDLYSCPALPEDDDFDFRCDTPLSTDKVTRF